MPVLYASSICPRTSGNENSVFVGNLSAVRQRTESIGFSPLVSPELPEGRSIIILWWIKAMEAVILFTHSTPVGDVAFVTGWLEIIAGAHVGSSKNAWSRMRFNFQGRMPDVVWLVYSIAAQLKCVGLVGLFLEENSKLWIYSSCFMEECWLQCRFPLWQNH